MRAARLADALTHADYAVSEAVGLDDAVHVFAAERSWHVLVCDAQLPDGTAQEVVAWARWYGVQAPAVILADRVTDEVAPGDDVIAKPVDPGELLLRVRAAVAPPSILVVDECPLVRRYAVEWLEAAGYAVVEAIDQADARRRAAERRIHLVVMDVDVTEGPSMLAAVAARHPRAPVLRTSRALAAGAAEGGVLVKPFDQAILVAAVQRAIA